CHCRARVSGRLPVSCRATTTSSAECPPTSPRLRPVQSPWRVCRGFMGPSEVVSCRCEETLGSRPAKRVTRMGGKASTDGLFLGEDARRWLSFAAQDREAERELQFLVLAVEASLTKVGRGHQFVGGLQNGEV